MEQPDEAPKTPTTEEMMALWKPRLPPQLMQHIQMSESNIRHLIVSCMSTAPVPLLEEDQELIVFYCAKLCEAMRNASVHGFFESE